MVYLWLSCDHDLRQQILNRDFSKRETECSRYVSFPGNVYLVILCPCLYVPTRGDVNHEIGIETPRWLHGRSLSLRELDVDISRKHRLQIECICTYHFTLRGIAYPIYHTPRRTWGSRQWWDCVRNSSRRAYASYRCLDILARLWNQNCFSSVMLQPVYLKSKKLSIFQDCNIMRPS